MTSKQRLHMTCFTKHVKMPVLLDHAHVILAPLLRVPEHLGDVQNFMNKEPSHMRDITKA
jgi:hypothetical protein